MRKLTVSQNDADQRLDRYLRKAFPRVPSATIQKWLREKRVRINGVRASGDARLSAGDELWLYIRDEFFDDEPREEDAFLSIENPSLDVVYEDAHIIICLKPSGLLSHPDEREKVNTLLTRIQAYLYRKGEYDPSADATFAPSLCHRIDRNTRGLVIAAKDAEALRFFEEQIREHRIEKTYRALVHGTPRPADGALESYILRDREKKTVRVFDSPRPGALYAKTFYHTVERRGDRTLVECRLVTGRTHQIRAQFASIGCPLVGDGKYGTLAKGEKAGQMLCAYKLRFAFEPNGGSFDYLAGRVFEIDAGF